MSRRQRVTLQTIADELGVSRSTISNAYGRPDQLKPELRQRILDTARRLGYAGPDAAGRSLRRGRADAIGLLFTEWLSYAFADPYHVSFLRGLAEVAEERHTSLLLIALGPAGDDEAAIHTVRHAVVDGFCVYCVPPAHPAWEVLRARDLPMVNAESSEDSGLPYVSVDERTATRQLGEHLVQLGHRTLAVVGDMVGPTGEAGPVRLAAPEDAPYYVAGQRMAGLRDAFAAVGVDWPEITVVDAARNLRAAGAQAAALVLDRADRPTAIAALSDVLALGVLDALRQRGLCAGRDVSVTGFDDIIEAAHAGLTTVHQPSTEKGRIAGRLLLDPPDDPADRQVVLATRVVPRATTGPVPRT